MIFFLCKDFQFFGLNQYFKLWCTYLKLSFPVDIIIHTWPQGVMTLISPVGGNILMEVPQKLWVH